MMQAPTLYCKLFHDTVRAFADIQGYSGRLLTYPEIFRLDCLIKYFTKSQIFLKELSKMLTEE